MLRNLLNAFTCQVAVFCSVLNSIHYSQSMGQLNWSDEKLMLKICVLGEQARIPYFTNFPVIKFSCYTSLQRLIKSSSHFTPNYPQEFGKSAKRTKLMSWWWQLLLDHGNESVESGNECLNWECFFPSIHPFSFTFFYDTEPFISYAPNCHFIFRYPREKKITPLSGIVSKPPLSWCVIKSLKSIKNDLKSIGFYYIMAYFTVVSLRKRIKKHNSGKKRLRRDWEGCDVII